MTQAPPARRPVVEPRLRLTRRRSRGLSALWPIWVVLPGAIVFWATGFSFATRLSVILPVALRLLMMPRVRVPPRFGLWLAFVAWVFLTSLQLPPRGILQFLIQRGGEYVAITLCMLLVYNLAPRGDRDGVWLRRAFLWAWLGIVVLGLVAVAFPRAELPSLARMVLPGGLTSQPFIQQITTPALAQVQSFLGFPLPRPSAPFAYANGWGGAMALLIPFVIASAVRGGPRDRRLARVGLVVSIVPIVMSMNRGMWGSILVGLLFLLATTREEALRRTLKRTAVAIGVVLVLASISPLGTLVATRLNTPHSNNARSDLAVQAGQRLTERPIIGFGAPLEYEGEGIRPPVGTQGQLWLMAISNGIPAALLFLGYFGSVFPLLKGRRMGQWTRASIVSMFVLLPFYSMLGGQLFIVCMAVAGAQREVYIDQVRADTEDATLRSAALRPALT